MFFETSRFGCRKTIFDVAKVTYDTYSCAISGMSREMMKMDGRDSVECQNLEKRDIIVIFELFKLDNKTKVVQCHLFQTKEMRKRERGKKVL